MKKGRKIWGLMMAAATICSCNKNRLNEPALGQTVEETLTNKKGVEGLLIGTYAMLDGQSLNDYTSPAFGSAASNWIYGSICGGEAYKGGSRPDDPPGVLPLEIFKPNAFNNILADKWAAVYEGVARANNVLRVMRKATNMTSADTVEVRAEVLFLRAFYHFEASKIWNKVPFVDESITVEAGNYYLANDIDIWPFIESDLAYAIDHLPVTQVAPGRANKYAAVALLVKSYMFQQKYTEAKPLLDDLILNGKTSGGQRYGLLKNYHDNFDPAKKNNEESVFAVQMSVNDGATPYSQNGNGGDFLNYPTVIGYGFFQPSQYLVNHFKTDSSGLPDLVNYNVNDVKNDEGILSADPFIPYTGALDPRLDWTVGRRGIPYLDWGLHPGSMWVREQSHGGPYSSKKNAVSQGEFEKYADNSWGPTFNANNVNLIRFADILLWAAEVEIELGSLDKAEIYINQIRNRAADSSGWVHSYIDSNNPLLGFSNIPAANYLIRPYPPGYFMSRGREYSRRAVRHERMLELAMEGHRFFDLVRWKIADTEINAYLQKEQIARDYLRGATFDKNRNEYFPIPYTQIKLSTAPDGIPAMKQNPGY